MGDQLQALDQVKTTAIDLAMKFGPKLVVAIVILIAGYMAGRWAARATSRVLARFQLEPPVRQLLERIVRLFVLGLFAIMALQNLGVELLPLIAGLGVAGAGLALATQGVRPTSSPGSPSSSRARSASAMTSPSSRRKARCWTSACSTPCWGTRTSRAS